MKEYVFEKEKTLFTDVTPMSVGYVDSNRKYHELIKRNEKLPTKKTFKFSGNPAKNTNLSLTIADSRDPASGQYSIIGHARLNNVPSPNNEPLLVTVSLLINENNVMRVMIREKHSGMEAEYYFNGIFDNIDEEVSAIKERNADRFQKFDERQYRNAFNEELYKKMRVMEDFVNRTNDEDCKITLMEMKEVLKRQSEFTCEQLKEIMEKVYTIFKSYHIM